MKYMQSSRQLCAGGRQHRTQKGFLSIGLAREEHPGLKDGHEPEVIKRSRRQVVDQDAAASAEQPPLSAAARQELHRLRQHQEI